MSDLERSLRELAAATRYPRTPDLHARVIPAIPDRRKPWRPVALAVAILVVAAGVALAVPPARSAILDWIGFGPVQVQRVEKLPVVQDAGKLALGKPTTLGRARRLTGFRVFVLPIQLDGVYVVEGEVTLVYGKLLLSERRGGNVVVARKVVGPETRVEDVNVAGAPGLWLAGAPHVFAYLDSNGQFQRGSIRLVGNTLLWQHGGLVLRLEGARTKARALRLAAAVR